MNSMKDGGPRYPESKDEADQMEADFLLELEKLSIHDHDKILLDIHGLGYDAEDPPELGDKLKELDQELNQIENKPAFERAREVNRSYVDDPFFRIMFLRARNYDAKLAAELLVWHFDCKQMLFGDGELLGRNILLSDLDEEATTVLETGSAQILPTRDAAGRAVDASSPQWDPQQVSTLSVCRAYWYYYMLVVQDEENQKKGFVSIFFNYGKYAIESQDLEEMRKSLMSIPCKLSVMHYCTNDETMMPFAAGVRQMMEGDERHRLRVHVGDPNAAHFALQTYGIPTDNTPLQPDGSWSTTGYREWLESQRARESNELKDGSDIITPRRHDVLFGRSKKCREHIGNTRLLYLCEKYLEEYNTVDKRSKTKITQSLMEGVKESNGRFLRWSLEGWAKVSDADAREKISHFFRHMRTKAPAASGKRTGKRTTPDSNGSTSSK